MDFSKILWRGFSVNVSTVFLQKTSNSYILLNSKFMVINKYKTKTFVYFSNDYYSILRWGLVGLNWYPIICYNNQYFIVFYNANSKVNFGVPIKTTNQTIDYSLHKNKNLRFFGFLNSQLFSSFKFWSIAASLIFFYLGFLFIYIRSSGTFSIWVSNPQITPWAHLVSDPHAEYNIFQSIRCFSGLYSLCLSWGYSQSIQVWNTGCFCFLLSFILFLLSIRPFYNILTALNSFKNVQLLASFFYLKSLSKIQIFKLRQPSFISKIGFFSFAWAGHLTHVSLPVSRGFNFSIQKTPHFLGLKPFFLGQWWVYLQNQDALQHTWGSINNSGTSLLSFHGLINDSPILTNVIHHHLAIGVLLIMLGFFTNGFGFNYFENDLQFSFYLGLLGFFVQVFAVQLTFISIYPFLDFGSQAALFGHHTFLSGLLFLGSFVHLSFYCQSDFIFNNKFVFYNDFYSFGFSFKKITYKPSLFWTFVFSNKQFIIGLVAWVSTFLGFHVLSIWCYNDVCVAFRREEAQILIQPWIALLIQHFFNLNQSSNNLFELNSVDWLCHHAISFAAHTTILVFLKGVLDSRATLLLPDKRELGFSFPCDGPGRGGTCDRSTLDAVIYLRRFWTLNLHAWVCFYWHWKHIAVWTNSFENFELNGSTLIGWFRDYLWFYSSELIHGYDLLGTSSLSLYAWIFLLGHLVFATSFIFLISWRGYWQELIETLVWAHRNRPFAWDFNWSLFSPAALSIVQARIVGLFHFYIGFIITYAAFLIGSVVGLGF